eukprot:6977466-Pyramimonas_sp.AAC.1
MPTRQHKEAPRKDPGGPRWAGGMSEAINERNRCSAAGYLVDRVRVHSAPLRNAILKLYCRETNYTRTEAKEARQARLSSRGFAR